MNPFRPRMVCQMRPKRGVSSSSVVASIVHRRNTIRRKDASDVDKQGLTASTGASGGKPSRCKEPLGAAGRDDPRTRRMKAGALGTTRSGKLDRTVSPGCEPLPTDRNCRGAGREPSSPSSWPSSQTLSPSATLCGGVFCVGAARSCIRPRSTLVIRATTHTDTTTGAKRIVAPSCRHSCAGSLVDG